MDMLAAAALFAIALLAGALNSVAGGGSFFTFPALVMTGMNPVIANATNTVALWPGSVASVFAYRSYLADRWRALVFPLILVFIGGLAGAVLLIKTPEDTFNFLLPWLMLLAISMFHWGARLRRALARFSSRRGEAPKRGYVGLIFQFIISLYGGYFGGGVGMMLLATFALTGVDNMHAQNAMKTLYASSINAAAVLYFVIAGAVDWPIALLMMTAAMLGGYFGALLAQKMPPDKVRVGVLFVGYMMTAYFFIR